VKGDSYFLETAQSCWKSDMAVTLIEAIETLKNGDALTWHKSGTFKAGTIHLSQPGQRRLFEFLVSIDEETVANLDESHFEALIAAWNNKDADPASSETAINTTEHSGPWRLDHIFAEGFGGLNTAGGPPFELQVGGENWCLDGYNGSGKTSLASLILWTLTGYRNREQDGPVKDNGRREPVTNGTKKIGTWPPLVTYPGNPVDLNHPAKVMATLTFKDLEGNSAQITRSVTSPVDGEPTVIVEQDEELILPAELIETGLLMPARIGHVGFGSKSQSLYDALKMLTGLDQLALIGQGASSLCHGARRFLKYAKNNGIEGLARAFSTSLERAKEHASDGIITIPNTLTLESEALDEDLTAIEENASNRAALALGVLGTEIHSELDLKELADRDRLNRAVETASVYVSEGHKGVGLFSAWAVLKQAEGAGFSDIQKPLKDAREKLLASLNWHEQQQVDEKLRLKALASEFFVPEDLLSHEAHCPLCETKLTSEDQLSLAAELTELKANSVAARRTLSDACRDIIQQLSVIVPEGIGKYDEALNTMNPRLAFADAIKNRFSDDEPFKGVLTGISDFTQKYADSIAKESPDFSPDIHTEMLSDIAEVKQVQTYIAKIERLSNLTGWWTIHREHFVNRWKSYLGVKDTDGNWPSESLHGKLQDLKSAIAGSDPLDKIATQMSEAKKHAASWSAVNEVQKTREKIAEAVEPLKNLVHLVDSETHRTIVTLKDRVEVILDEIRLRDRLSYVETAMNKKTVTVAGQLSEGMQINAALVANSSWLRAVLWAFIFALREQAIHEKAQNVFPLMVLDDPQTTFDQKNKRKWAEKIARVANLDESSTDGMQLFLLTHEREFSKLLSLTNSINGQKGKLAAPSSSSRVAHVINGTHLDRLFTEAAIDEDEEKSCKYVEEVRKYCEGLLKIILRPESFEINGGTLNPLTNLLEQMHNDGVAPFNRRTFKKLIAFLDVNSQPAIKLLNASHHEDESTIGFTQAEQVKKYWDKHLRKAFYQAFQRAADYDAYGGASHLFPANDNPIDFPEGHSTQIKAISFSSSGVVAAAESDGLIGSGLIELEEWEQPETIKLFKHSAYRLNANTLDPVVGIGDIIIVQDFGEPRDRNLTVTSLDGKLYARRLNKSEDNGEIVVLTAQATDPYALHIPLVVPQKSISPRKIVGTLFMSKTAPMPKDDGQEVCEISDFNIVGKHLENVTLFKVKGRSMEPIALEGQFVMTVDVQLSSETLSSMNGELIIAVDEDDGVYFKRMRLHDDLVVLESANSSSSTSSEILSLVDSAKHKKLLSIRAVIGVLFDLPSNS